MSDSQEIIRAVSTDDDDACPVCLSSPSDQLLFVAAPCQHAVCQPCMERILLTQHGGMDLHIPTRGKCPICRCQVSLFELKTVVNDKLAYPIDTDIFHSPIGGLVYKYDGRLGASPDFALIKKLHILTLVIMETVKLFPLTLFIGMPRVEPFTAH